MVERRARYLRRPRKSPLMRFWDKTREDGDCLIWVGAATKEGYGRIVVNGKLILATHYAWFAATNEWPKLNILHKCDNPACVKYEHLFEGTHGDNLRDAAQKGLHWKQRYAK